MMRHFGLVLGLVGAVALATGACTSSGGNNNGQHDAATDGFHQLDGGQGDGGGDGGGGTCTKTGITGTASGGYSGQDNAVFYDVLTSENVPYDAFEIAFYFDYGNPQPTIGPGTYTLGATEEERSLATCGTCVMAWANCGEESCAKTFFAKSGTLTITKMNNTDGLVGTLTDGRLVEVTIAQDGSVTEVNGGDSWCFPNHAVNMSFAEYPLPCESNTDCAGTTDTPYCLTEYGECVQCLQESHCASLTATPHCLVEYGACVECTENAHCASSTYGQVCDTYYGECGQCVSAMDCHDPTKPICGYNSTTYRGECQAGGTCTDDDTAAEAAGDDGPIGATALTVGVAANAHICKATGESDYYKYTLAAAGNLTVTVAWTATGTDLDIYVYDSTGEEVDSAYTTSETSPETLAMTSLAAGTYYIEVQAWTPTTTVPYTITVTTP